MRWKIFFVLTFFVNQKAISQSTIQYNNQIKTGFTSLVKGDFFLGFERQIKQKLSGELDLGILTRDYAENFFYEVSTSQEKTSLPGFSLASSVRYYPIVPLDLLFVTAEFKFRHYRYSSSEIITSESKEFEQRYTPRLGVGYIVHMDEHFNFDISGNLGFTFKKNSIDQTANINGPSPNKFHFGLNIKFSYCL